MEMVYDNQPTESNMVKMLQDHIKLHKGLELKNIFGDKKLFWRQKADLKWLKEGN